MDKKLLESVIEEILRPKGFKKKGSTWYRQAPTVLQLVNLQKSLYGSQFFVNLCFIPEGIPVDGMPTPKEHKCPIRIRLTSVLPADRAEIETLFDLEEQAIADQERSRRIRDLLATKVLAFLDQLQDMTGLRLAIEKGAFKLGAVNRLAQELFGIPMS